MVVAGRRAALLGGVARDRARRASARSRGCANGSCGSRPSTSAPTKCDPTRSTAARRPRSVAIRTSMAAIEQFADPDALLERDESRNVRFRCSNTCSASSRSSRATPTSSSPARRTHGRVARSNRRSACAGTGSSAARPASSSTVCSGSNSTASHYDAGVAFCPWRRRTQRRLARTSSTACGRDEAMVPTPAELAGPRPVARAYRSARALMVQRIGVLGAGVMGGGIAQVCAIAGYDVVVYDIAPDALDRRATNTRRRDASDSTMRSRAASSRAPTPTPRSLASPSHRRSPTPRKPIWSSRRCPSDSI